MVPQPGGLRGEPVADDLSGTENEWLGSLSNELASVSEEQSAIAAEKGQQIKGQIAEIQLEADQANELIKKLGAETLEPPSTVLQSLTSSDFASEEADNENETGVKDNGDKHPTDAELWTEGQHESGSGGQQGLRQRGAGPDNILPGATCQRHAQSIYCGGRGPRLRPRPVGGVRQPAGLTVPKQYLWASP